MSNPPKKSLPRPGRKPKNDGQPPVERPQVESDTKAQTSGSAANSRQIALLAARAGLEKKATGIEIIDVMGKVDYADYLVLMTGASDRNVAAIAQEVDGELAKAGFRSMAIEGLPAAKWVLIDFVDVVVHVFQRDVRSLYDLDGLWMDAARVPMETAPAAQVLQPAVFDEPASLVRKPRATKATKAAPTAKPRPSTARKAPAKRVAKAAAKSRPSTPLRGKSTTRKGPRTKSDT